MRARPGDIVVLTGASGGLGLHAAAVLGARGYRVCAGARGERTALEALPGVTVCTMDVTMPQTLRDASATVDAMDGRLGGVVVNAGIAVAAPIELVDLDLFRSQLEVNVVGAVATLQAFLPRLRRDAGRIVLMSSVSGRRSAPIIGPYAASKFALEAIGDALRMEVGPLGVDVVILEPGGVKTPIWRRSAAAADRNLADLPDSLVEPYEDLIGSLRNVVDEIEHSGIEAEAVSALIVEVLETSRPRTRYPLGKRVGLQTRMLTRLLPDRLFDRLRLAALRRSSRR